MADTEGTRRGSPTIVCAGCERAVPIDAVFCPYCARPQLDEDNLRDLTVPVQPAAVQLEPPRGDSTSVTSAAGPPIAPTSAPSPGKPIWRRWWAIATAAVVLLVVIGNLVPDKHAATDTAAEVATRTSEVTEPPTTAEVTTVTTMLPATTVAPATTAPAATLPARPAAAQTAPARTAPSHTDAYAGETVSQSNARRKAADYLDYTSFSRKGLIDQLEYEGFSEGDAVYGVDAQNADWFDQAAKKAQAYMEYSSFSRQSMIEQLEYDGFSQPEAEHGADSVGL